MGPFENPTLRRKTQAASVRKRRACRPRLRRCLLKGCEQLFRPRQMGQRYCSERCRGGARKWLRWKAQQRYRRSVGGKQRRKGQNQRYRERVKARKLPEPAAVSQAARVITPQHFFRAQLRPAGVLRALRASAAKSFAAFLFARLPARLGASAGAGTRVATSAHLIRTY